MLRPDSALISCVTELHVRGQAGPRYSSPAARPLCRDAVTARGSVADTGRRALMKAADPVRDHLRAGTRAARSSGHDQGRPLVEAVDEVGQFL